MSEIAQESTSGTSVSPFAQPLDIYSILTTKPEPLDHVLPGLLAGTVGMLAGAGGVGKTMFELQVAVALATGTPACGGLYAFKAPAPVVLVAAEEDARVLTHRLHAIVHTMYLSPEKFGIAVAGPEFAARLARNLRLFSGSTHGLTLLTRDWSRTARVKQLADAAEGARLVLVDPLRQFHDCDENDAGAMNEVLLALRHVAMQSGAAVVFAHHANKAATFGGQGDVAGAARGSSALTDGVRWQLNLSRPSKEQAQRLSIAEDYRGAHLSLDLAKANYVASQETVALERLSGGVLALRSGVAGARSVGAQGKGTAPRQLRLAGAQS